MKKGLIATVGVIVIGGVLGLSYYNGNINVETEDKPAAEVESKTVAAEADQKEENETTKEVVIEAPIERTVETNGDYPWERFRSAAIIEQQNAGEVVYLFSDAEPLENMISSFSTSEPIEDAPISKEENSESMAGYLDAFISGVEKYYPAKKEYFDKLRSVKDSLLLYDYDSIPQQITEAKQLR